MTHYPTTVIVGMSGGVDSSVSALLLKQQGYRVIGLFMKNWEEKNDRGVCTSTKEYEDVVKVCQHLDIPYYSVNFVEEYRNQVFSHFIDELKLGHTPNPDILCNREIKFQAFLSKAKSLGADYLAMGHYCRIGGSKEGPLLLKGTDPGKDQSYFLYTLQKDILKQVLFPVGHLVKDQVRSIAKAHGLSTAEKKDSTGICFIGERNFKEFLRPYIPYQEGAFMTLDGKKVGTHVGIAYYTIGQRKGIGIGGEGEAWFVVGKCTRQNVVYVAQGTNHPALYANTLTASEITWVSPTPPSFPINCNAKIRYRQKDQACIIEKQDNNVLHIRFMEPQRAITPRQSIVFYNEDVCLGGAMIIQGGPSLYEEGIKEKLK
ncbi:MAG: tRNA 2-thiouridine(34) synthase MnmA [Chlamydiae bacterium]|nr:tRNA 2-thiouridine(34) synthase MnmA [Chlamydiota bacterium]